MENTKHDIWNKIFTEEWLCRSSLCYNQHLEKQRQEELTFQTTQGIIAVEEPDSDEQRKFNTVTLRGKVL